MTGIAFCRKPPRTLARSKLMRWAQGGSDRRWQDKAPKVRAAGWGVKNPRIPVALHTLRNIPRNLRFSATRFCRSAFYTL
jgi:hypothetical protein